MNNEVLAKNVAYVRRRLFCRQNDFAKECGINPGNFSKAMSGKLPFSEQMLMNIAKVAGTTYEELISEDFISKCKKGGDTGRLIERSPETKNLNADAMRMTQLEKENEMLKAQIEKQETEIKFYRNLLLQEKGEKERSV